MPQEAWSDKDERQYEAGKASARDPSLPLRPASRGDDPARLPDPESIGGGA